MIKRQIFVVGEDINEYFTVYDRYLKTTLSEFYEKIKPLCKSIVEKNPQLQLSDDGTGFFRNDIYPFENLQNVQNLSTDLHIDQPEELKMKTYADFIEPSKQLEQKCQIIYNRMINALLLSENKHR
ncbi:MAG: hypothetical protein IJA94_05710 [Bacilli bacterium]|nr:hypothetical protein [Bacilli bacterium]